ncbi:MAG: gliding motility lipoprotein GldD [Ginsengibacter sp.]
MFILRKAFSIILILLLLSCNSPYTSKKRGYYKIDLPKRAYVKFEKPGFPFSFEYPSYAQIIRDGSYFDSTSDNPYWFNISFPSFNGKIYLSYKTIGGKSIYKIKRNNIYTDSVGFNSFDKMVGDAYKLTFKNDVKAYSIEDSLMHTPLGITGIFFRVSGNVATAKQFFLTDSTKHFLRGALYFDATPNEDSLRPVNDFLQEDMKHLINTLRWN